MMNQMKCFPGQTASKKTNIVFMFFSVSKVLFRIHFSAQCSLFQDLAYWAALRCSKIAFLVNVVKFCESGKFKRFFQMPIFIGSLDDRICEHQKRINFTLLHFWEISHEIE
jgi:hypothetical protein